MDMRLKGLTALVTGGGTGIGRATAERFAKEGACVVVTGRRPEFIQETVEAITIEGGSAISVTGDVSDAAAAAEMVRQTIETFGRLDILINNAGVFRGGSLVEMSAENIELLVRINLLGPLNVARAAIPELIKTKGCILNVSSALARVMGQGVPSTVYSATKGALESLTKALAVELAPFEVRVNAVAPAVVETPIYETIMPKEAVRGALDEMQDIHPLARNGRPEEIAAALAFLASPAYSGWTTGSILCVDGGRSCL